MTNTNTTAETLRAAIETARNILSRAKDECQRADDAMAANDTPETRAAFDAAYDVWADAVGAYLRAVDAVSAAAEVNAGNAGGAL